MTRVPGGDAGRGSAGSASPRPIAVILSGARGSGKTSVCMRLAGVFPRYAGIVCPGIFDAEAREVGKLALCLPGAESWELARTDADLGGPRTGRFSFSAPGIARAVACIRAALSGAGAPPPSASDSPLAPFPGLCVIDEIGLLELDRAEGFAPILPLLESSGPLIATVRTGLESRIAKLLPRHEIVYVGLDAMDVGEAVRRIADSLSPTGSGSTPIPRRGCGPAPWRSRGPGPRA